MAAIGDDETSQKYEAIIKQLEDAAKPQSPSVGVAQYAMEQARQHMEAAVKSAEALEAQAQQARERAADAYNTFERCEHICKESVVKLASEVVATKETSVASEAQRISLQALLDGEMIELDDNGLFRLDLEGIEISEGAKGELNSHNAALLAMAQEATNE
eukprot:3191083-Pyramimonas_sp.AAC.1